VGSLDRSALLPMKSKMYNLMHITSCHDHVESSVQREQSLMRDSSCNEPCRLLRALPRGNGDITTDNSPPTWVTNGVCPRSQLSNGR
jgi:hypothetical protein